MNQKSNCFCTFVHSLVLKLVRRFARSSTILKLNRQQWQPRKQTRRSSGRRAGRRVEYVILRRWALVLRETCARSPTISAKNPARTTISEAFVSEEITVDSVIHPFRPSGCANCAKIWRSSCGRRTKCRLWLMLTSTRMPTPTLPHYAQVLRRLRFRWGLLAMAPKDSPRLTPKYTLQDTLSLILKDTFSTDPDPPSPSNKNSHLHRTTKLTLV